MKIHFYKAREGKLGDKVVGIVSVFSFENWKFYTKDNSEKYVNISYKKGRSIRIRIETL